MATLLTGGLSSQGQKSLLTDGLASSTQAIILPFPVFCRPKLELIWLAGATLEIVRLEDAIANIKYLEQPSILWEECLE